MHAEFTFQLGDSLRIPVGTGPSVRRDSLRSDPWFFRGSGREPSGSVSGLDHCAVSSLANFRGRRWPQLGHCRRLLGGIGAETLFGVTLGLAVAFLLEGMQLAAQVLGLQAGYSYASTVDPTTQADTTTLQLMAQLLAGMLFFAFGFDRQVLKALARSLESAPGRAFSLDGHAIEAIVHLGAAIFTTGLQLAIPVLALLVLLDIAFAVLGRLHAQLQLLSLSFAIKMLAAVAFLAGILSVYPAVFERTGAITFMVLDRVLNP